MSENTTQLDVMRTLLSEIAATVESRLGEFASEGWTLTVVKPVKDRDPLLVSVGTTNMTIVAIEGVFREGQPYLKVAGRFIRRGRSFYPDKNGRFPVDEISDHLLAQVKFGIEDYEQVEAAQRALVSGVIAYQKHDEKLSRLPARWGHEAWNAENVQLSAGYVVPYDKLDAVTVKLHEIEAILRGEE